MTLTLSLVLGTVFISSFPEFAQLIVPYPRSENEKIKEMYRRIKELLDRGEIRQIRSKDDEGTRFGHKTPTHQFFGYKTHIP